MYWISVYTFGALLHISVPQLWRDSLLFKGFSKYYHSYASIIMKSHRANRCYPDAFIVQDLNRCTEFQYTSFGALLHISVPQLWRDSLLFNGFSNYFHSIHQTYRSHIGATGVIAMLSLCRTWIEVLKLSLHSWGTSSVSVPQLWRDSLFFNGNYRTTFIQYIKHTEVTWGQQVLSRCFHWGTSSISVPQLWRDSLLFKEI